METHVATAARDEKPILRNLLELYLYDTSDLDAHDVGPSGLFGSNYLDHYWTEPDRHPFLIRVDGALAGFALVNRHSYLTTEGARCCMAEFFVMRRYRGRGVGMCAAASVFDRLPGPWEVCQTAANIGAQAFWRKTVDHYTSGLFAETVLTDGRWDGPILTFDNTHLGSAV
jgi:predicted acetyltransferase